MFTLLQPHWPCLLNKSGIAPTSNSSHLLFLCLKYFSSRVSACFLTLTFIFSQTSLSVKSSLYDLNCNPSPAWCFVVSSLLVYFLLTIHHMLFFPLLISVVPKAIDTNPRAVLGLSNFKSTGLKNFKKGPQKTTGGRRGTWEGVPSHIHGVLERNTLRVMAGGGYRHSNVIPSLGPKLMNL